MKDAFDVGAQGGYGYALRDGLSVGARAGIRGTFGQRTAQQSWPLSHITVSLPLVLTVEPRVSDQLRVVVAVGFGYQHIWTGPSTMSRDNWSAYGYEALGDLGLTLKPGPGPLELVGLVGVRYGQVLYAGDTRYDADGFLAVSFPVSLGVRQAF
ncbi:MAG: hypothetical protein QM756_14875 [Polyangiaceae bacterium]